MRNVMHTGLVFLILAATSSCTQLTETGQQAGTGSSSTATVSSSQPAQMRDWKTYESAADGYSIQYPPDWTARERDLGPFSEDGTGATLLGPTAGTTLNEAWLHVVVSPACPTVFGSVTQGSVNATPFTKYDWDDDAMGGARMHGDTYVHPINALRCISVTTAVQYHDPSFGNGETPDVAGEKRLPQDRARFDELFRQILTTLQLR